MPVVDNMKAMTAINVIIILILGVIALVALIGMLMGVWTPARSGITLQVATQNICKIINPAYCNPQATIDCQDAEHLPIFDFDVDGDGVSNEHVPSPRAGGGTWPTTYSSPPTNDNFGALCCRFHGGPCGIGGNEVQWYETCLIRVCGCPRLAGAGCS